MIWEPISIVAAEKIGRSVVLVILSVCRLAYTLGFRSLLKYIDIPLPHSSEECSPQGFIVYFAKVDGNSVEHWELMHLLWDSFFPF